MTRGNDRYTFGDRLIEPQMRRERKMRTDDSKPRAPTRRQMEVLQLLVVGLTTKEMAAELHLSEPAIKKHLGVLMRRYTVDSRVALLGAAIAAGVITVEVHARP